MNEDVRELLRKRKYMVTVEATEEGGVFINFPKPTVLFPTIPKIDELFTPTRENGEVGLILIASYLETPKFISVPEYAMRLLVSADIASWCRRLMVNLKLVDFIDQDKAVQNSINDVMHGPATEEDTNKEGFLNKLIIEGQLDGFQLQYEKIAETHGVLEGYKLIKELYV